MKSHLTRLVLAATLILPTLSWAQGAPEQGHQPQGGPPPMQGGQMGPTQGGPPGGPMHGPENSQMFEQHKAEALQHIDHHIQEEIERKRCVEGSQNHEMLRACFPRREGGGGQMQGGPPGGGQQQR